MRRNNVLGLTLILASAFLRLTAAVLVAAQQPAAPPVGQDVPRPNAPESRNIPAAVLARLQSDGLARVIVQLNAPARAEGALNGTAVQQQRQAIATAQVEALGRLPQAGFRLMRQFETIPFMALEVTAEALAALAANGEILSIEEDRIEAAVLSESVALVNGDDAWTAGYDGTGWAVAVLDTGVDKNHPFLSGKVVSEACYSANGNCPNGSSSQTGAGAGVQCTYAPSGCRHGTHVAGIAAGSSASFSGVARGASVIAVQVFSRFTGSNCSGQGEDPCTLTWTSDQVAGLERVYALRSSFNIAAVNMSIGGSAFTSQASCDSSNASRKAVIDNLRSAGIATVIASGNDAFVDRISAPACISTAVSVGSTTKSDDVSWFSNSASFLSLLAPGSSINSSVPGGSFVPFDGTSMATPHVAGAWAVLKQISSSATVSAVLQALQATGTAITDPGNGVVTPRIDVKSALDQFNRNLSISDTRVIEGHGGTTNATFTVSLSATSAVDVTVDWATADDTALSATFSNAATIDIPVESSPPTKASLYPSTITIPAGYGTVTNVTVVLEDITHRRHGDFDVMLTGPGGQTVVLMSDIACSSGDGVCNAGPGLTGVTLTIDDAAAGFIPTNPASGTYRPSNYATGFGCDSYPTPGPGSLCAPTSDLLSVFNGTAAAGAWSLYVVDDAWDGNRGSLAGGWSLILRTTATDYDRASGTITLAAGATSQTLTVPIVGDAIREVPVTERFAVNLASAANAKIADGQGIGTVVDDDFTDTSLTGVVMKTAHVTELRTLINELRALKGLSAFGFTDATLGATTTIIKAVHIIELRTALNAVYAAAGQPAPGYTDPSLTAGVTAIKAVHITELRDKAVNAP